MQQIHLLVELQHLKILQCQNLATPKEYVQIPQAIASQPMSQHIRQSSIIWRHIAESNDNELALLLHPNCWYLAAIATKDVLPPSLHDAADVSMHDATSKPKGGMVGCTCADNTEVYNTLAKECTCMHACMRTYAMCAGVAHAADVAAAAVAAAVAAAAGLLLTNNRS